MEQLGERAHFEDFKMPDGNETKANIEPDPEDTLVQFEESTIAEAVVAVRNERKAMSSDEWLKRISGDASIPVEIPEGYIFYSDLQEELALIPEEWRQKSRKEDRPPPPVFDRESRIQRINLPDTVYAAGVKWEVGNRVNKGAFGSVYETWHSGDEEQKNRLVKFVSIKGDVEDAEGGRGRMWNEVGGAMAAGDYLCSEVIQDKNGDTLLAIVMEQYQDNDMFKSRTERMRSGEEMLSSPEWGYQLAVALRSVVATLRKMHSLGWIHRDVKPGNIMLPKSVDEAMLAHLIDYGLAKGGGVVRATKSDINSGTPSYMLPETYLRDDDDLRIRDYWGAMISVANTMGFIKINRGVEIKKVQEQLIDGKYLECANLFNPNSREDFFKDKKIDGALREFLQWIYDFLQPQMNMDMRRSVWKEDKIIETRLLSYKTKEQGKVVDKHKRGDFFNDDKFVRELEGHIRALADQAGVKMPEGMIERFQEFPVQA